MLWLGEFTIGIVKSTNKLAFSIIYLVFGIALGGVAKYLDTVTGVDGSWWMNILPYFGDLCSRTGIWVLIATLIMRIVKSKLVRPLIHSCSL